MKTTVTIDIDTDQIESYHDQCIAGLWHVAQANPADRYASPEPGQLAETIGREIIRRFLKSTTPELWSHQGSHFHWGQRHLDGDARALGRWEQIRDELVQRKLLDHIDDDVMANIQSAVVKIIREDDSRFVKS